MNQFDIEIQGETITLLADRALFWQRESMLLVADTHWGKADTFRAASIAVPGNLIADDLARLDRLIDHTGAKRLCVLGDLLHAKRGRDPALLAEAERWRNQHADLDVVLVRGNHDHGAGDPPDNWHMTCVDAPYFLAPFALVHTPEPTPGYYSLGGHIHPAVLLTGSGRQQLSLPCFWFGAQVGVLPAFGSFTGNALIYPEPTDRVYALAEESILPL